MTHEENTSTRFPARCRSTGSSYVLKMKRPRNPSWTTVTCIPAPTFRMLSACPSNVSAKQRSRVSSPGRGYCPTAKERAIAPAKCDSRDGSLLNEGKRRRASGQKFCNTVERRVTASIKDDYLDGPNRDNEPLPCKSVRPSCAFATGAQALFDKVSSKATSQSEHPVAFTDLPASQWHSSPVSKSSPAEPPTMNVTRAESGTYGDRCLNRRALLPPSRRPRSLVSPSSSSSVSVWLVLLALLLGDCLRLPRLALGMLTPKPWDSRHWCDIASDPVWPWAYQKHAGQALEWKGRSSSNLQDLRHACDLRGARCKCHVCASCDCGVYGDEHPCPLQLQGVSCDFLPRNVPAVSDTPWAVGGSHRNAFLDAYTHHTCVMQSGGRCLDPFREDYAGCQTRCWGFDSGVGHWTELSGWDEYQMQPGGAGVSQQGRVRTLAGGNGKGFKDGGSSSAKFSDPQDVAVDEARNVYVADTGNHRIRMILPSGTVLTLAGDGAADFDDGAASSASFSSPGGVAVFDDTGPAGTTVFVADTGNHRIRKITSAGVVSCFAGLCGESPRPGFADGAASVARFAFPLGVAVDSNGVVYVADTGNHLIRRIDALGEVRTLAGKIEAKPVDPSCPPPCLRGVRGYSDGDLLSAQFSYPSDLALSPAEDALFVTDDHRVRMVTFPDLLVEKQGTSSRNRVSTVAGGPEEGHRDGEGHEARLNKPEGIEVAADGRIYVAEAVGNKVKRISEAAQVARDISCSTTVDELVRPRGCSSYEQPRDDLGLFDTPLAGHVYYNYEDRDVSDPVGGVDVLGRSPHYCIGFPPVTELEKGNLVVDMKNPEGASLGALSENMERGTAIRVRCPSFCHPSPGNQWLFGTETYTSNSRVCEAALHAGVIDDDAGGMLEVVLLDDWRFYDDFYRLGQVRNGISSYDMPDLQTAARLFFVRQYPIARVEVQTIAGHAAAKLEDSFGFSDAEPPQAALFHRPSGVSLYRGTSLTQTELLIVADTKNHAIRTVTATCAFVCENGGRCVAPDTCLCHPGWGGHDCSLPLCLSGCGPRQVCVAPDVCDCIPGYTGFPSCQVPLCRQPCFHGGYCGAPDTCFCADGWFDPQCTTPVCEQTCGNGGKCVAPNTCQCPLGWGGPSCRTPVCSAPCGNGGYCIAPETCACPPQWTGHDCSIPICSQGYFLPDPSPFMYATDRPRYWDMLVPCGYEEWCQATNGFDCQQEQRRSQVVVDGQTYAPGSSQIPFGPEASEDAYASSAYPATPQCFLIELEPDAMSWFQYLDEQDELSAYMRYSQHRPYGCVAPGYPWSAVVAPTGHSTVPYLYQEDRQVALVERRRVAQGVYVCANGGHCAAPDVCHCAQGWAGFDCRTPVCQQGYYDPGQGIFADNATHPETQSNPAYSLTKETIYRDRVEVEVDLQGEQRYMHEGGTFQGGYWCSLRALTAWERPETVGPYAGPAFIFEHPNFYSRFMDRVQQPDSYFYSQWEGMGWPPTHEKTMFVLDETSEGYRRGGIWRRTGEPWRAGKCHVRFVRVCPEDPSKTVPYGAPPESYGQEVLDPDAAYRARLNYSAWGCQSENLWWLAGGECVDHVVGGCYNNGTCVAPDTCICAEGWSGPDCATPVCSQSCLHGGNCTLPDTCTCERGWSGADCSVPICAQECRNGGKCVAPDTCACRTWPSALRDSTANGGRPLFRQPNGDPQVTGYTGFDCSTPICVQAEAFLLNVAITSPLSVALGGHGKDGLAQCDEVRCPIFDLEVVRNDGLSFQSGCPFGNPQPNPISSLSVEQQIANWYNGRDDLNVNRTSALFLCGVLEWWQGDYDKPRTMRVNYHNYSVGEDGEVQMLPASPGEGLYACAHRGSCIAPDTCTCTDGWEGFDCNTPKCRHQQRNQKVVSCLHGGVCGEKDQCTCIRTQSILHNIYEGVPKGVTGWMGTDCSIAMCIQGFFDPDCESNGGEGCYRCPNNGQCVAPDLCACAEGWTGHDCRTPICEQVADEEIIAQLDTIDDNKIRMFEVDPCGTQGTQWGKELVSGVLLGQGNCTMPNLCTCLCTQPYDEFLCETTGEYCEKPWWSFFGLSIPAGYTYGSKECAVGYEGKQDVLGRFQSCHLKIYTPTFYERYSTTVIAVGSVAAIFGIVGYFAAKKKLKQREMLARRERRRQRRLSMGEDDEDLIFGHQ